MADFIAGAAVASGILALFYTWLRIRDDAQLLQLVNRAQAVAERAIEERDRLLRERDDSDWWKK